MVFRASGSVAAALALVLAAALASPAMADQAAATPERSLPPPSVGQTAEERATPSPKDVVNAFNQMAFFDGDPVGAMRKYLSDDFVERYPDFTRPEDAGLTDKEATIRFFETRGWKAGEQNTDTVYQVIAEGDRVAVFHHVKLNPDDRGIAFVDIFRVDDGLIVEHWAVGQPVSDKVSPRHPMF